jgi:hypothetical protein
VGALVDDVTSVERGGGLEEQEPAFFIGCGLVFDAAGDDYELSFLDPFVMFAKVFIAVMHAEAAFDDEKQFVFMLVVVEDELTFDFVELDGLTVEFGCDVGLPVFGNLGEFFGDVDFGHGIVLERQMSLRVEGRKDEIDYSGARVPQRLKPNFLLRGLWHG